MIKGGGRDLVSLSTSLLCGDVECIWSQVRGLGF